MLLKIANLGRIKKAQLELRPFTVFVGKNNLNKSWTAYATYFSAYSISFDAVRNRKFPLTYGDGEVSKTAHSIFSSSIGLADGNRTVHAATLFPDVQTVIGQADANGLSATCAGSSATSSIEVTGRPKFVNAVHISVERIATRYRVVALYNGVRAQQLDWLVDEAQLEETLVTLLSLGSTPFTRAFFFPTERPILAQNVISPIIADRLGLPVQSCLEWLSEARERASARRPLAGMPEVAALLATAAGGQFAVDANGGVSFEGEDFSVPLASAGSMARSLASLSLYLNNLAQPGDVIIIDEPELNAHPEAQLAIVELLAVLSRRGVVVIFTTHSPYILDHIDNLLEASRPGSENAANSFALKTADAFLEPEHVAVFEFIEKGDQVVVEDILDREEREIATSTFGRVSERLGKVMNDVLDRQDDA